MRYGLKIVYWYHRVDIALVSVLSDRYNKTNVCFKRPTQYDLHRNSGCSRLFPWTKLPNFGVNRTIVVRNSKKIFLSSYAAPWFYTNLSNWTSRNVLLSHTLWFVAQNGEIRVRGYSQITETGFFFLEIFSCLDTVPRCSYFNTARPTMINLNRKSMIYVNFKAYTCFKTPYEILRPFFMLVFGRVCFLQAIDYIFRVSIRSIFWKRKKNKKNYLPINKTIFSIRASRLTKRVADSWVELNIFDFVTWRCHLRPRAVDGNSSIKNWNEKPFVKNIRTQCLTSDL